MEDAYRTHKGNAEFGWTLLIKQAWQAGKRRRAKAAGRGASLEVLGGVLSLPSAASGPKLSGCK
jgi:hypothetical protein